MNSRTLIVMTLAVVGATIIGSRQVANARELATKQVSYADLNLDSDAGTKVFFRRVRIAAESVCTGFDQRDQIVSLAQEA